MTTPTNYGAASADWAHFTLLLGMGADLLPVVSNPQAVISPDSAMQAIGKTPSRYNNRHQVSGFKAWPQHQATDADIARWSAEPDYGICVITRDVRAIDVDVSDCVLADTIRIAIAYHLHMVLPVRERTGTGKFLLAFRLPGDMPKRVLHVEGGIVEFLATGQQFIACGTHPSGARYEWPFGLPDEFPELTLEQFDGLWAALDKRFSIEPAASDRLGPIKADKLRAAAHADPLAEHMFTHGQVRSQDREGKLHIVCPWEIEHTTQAGDGDTATTYWPAHTGGYINGHFKCLHAHCADRTDADFKGALGFVDDDLSDFDDLGDMPEAPAETPVKRKYPTVTAAAFASRPAPTWIIKDILPRAELVVLFGESTAGKSFAALDLAGAIARGMPWHGHRTKAGRVVYVCAEGAGGFRNRLVAYAAKEQIDLADIPLDVIAGAPNLLDKADAIDVARSIGRADLVIIDTFAQATAGANENSGEDIGKALAHCKGIHRATGATVVLVHHAGKDLTKGARGWSGLRAAADAEIEVSRQDPVRMLRISKQKDGQDGLTYYFDLTQVPIGMDEDGDIITSCVMNYNISAPVKQQKVPKMNPWEDLIMSVVTEFGAVQSAGIERKSVVDEAARVYQTTGGDSKNARILLNRAIKTLDEKGFFVLEDDCISLLKGEI